MAKDIASGLLGGFLGSLIFIPIMLLVPGTLFMNLIMSMTPMSGANIFGWVLHAVVNSVWGLIFVLLLKRIKTKRVYLFSLIWSLVLAGIVLSLVPSFGLQITPTLITVETIAYISYSIILWATYSFFATKKITIKATKGSITSNILLIVSKPKYAILVILLSLALFSIFIFLNNISLFVSTFEVTKDFGTMPKIFLNAVDMIMDIGGIVNFIAVVIASILGGLSISMIIYQITNTRKLGTQHGLLSFGGVFGGALSSSCAACSSALIATFGVVGGLAIFPLKGLELSLSAIAVLLFSIYITSKNLNKSSECKIRGK